MKKKFIIPLLSLSMIVGLASCGNNNSSSSSNQSQENIDVNKAVVVDQVTRSYLQVGETYQLTAHVYGTKNDMVTYTSSNSSIASVSSTGLVTGVKAGNVNIIAIASDDKTIRKVIKFTIVDETTTLVPGLDEVINSISALNFEEGVKFDGNISLNLGDVKLEVGELLQDKLSVNTILTSSDISMPVSIDVRQDEKETEEVVQPYVHASLPIGDLIDSLISSNKDLNSIKASIPLKGTMVSGIAGLIDNDYSEFLSAKDNDDCYCLDIYDYGEETFYTSLNRDFGSEENHSYSPYAFEDNSGISLLGQIAGPIYNLLKNSDSSFDLSTLQSSLEINSLSDLFSKDTLLKLQVMLKDYLESEESENGSKVKFTDSFLSLINTSMSKKNIGGITKLDLNNGVVIKVELPKEFSEISLNLVKKDDVYTSMNLSLKGKKVDGSEYEVLNISLDIPTTTIGKETIDDDAFKTADYISASSSFICGNTSNMITSTTSCKEINKKAEELYQMVNTYKLDLSTSKQAISDVTSFLDYYFDKHYASEERQNLLYPMYSKLETINVSRDVVTIQYPYTTFKNDDYISVNHYVDFKPVDDFTYSFKSNKENIASVTEEGILTGHKYYSGTVTAGNNKGFNNNATIKVTITPKEESTLTKAQNLSASLYYGGEAEFEETKTILLPHEKFDVETHTLTLQENEEFDLTQIISFPEGYTISSIGFGNTKKILDSSVTKKDNLVVKTLTKQLDEDGISYRSLASVQINLTYPDPEDSAKTIKEKVIIFVSIA